MAGESASPESLRNALTTAAWGMVWIAGAVWFWLWLAGNPINDLRLTLAAKTAPGQIIDTSEEVEEGDDGRDHWYHAAAYTFWLPDGREIKGTTRGSGRLRPEFADPRHPIPVQVEYDPNNPAVNRLKGDGSQSILDWLLRKVGLGGLLLILFVAPGFLLIRQSVKSLRASRPVR